jgi:[CysO sulfur-carrier protein]-S-L-cysteine hydrolase
MPDTTTPVIHLPAAMRDEIVGHARAEAPRECCGVISGQHGRPVRLYRLTNVEPGTRLYRIDDTELFHVYRELQEHGADILAIYHSHPASPAYPSSTDVALAFWSEAFYLICSLAEPGSPDIRAFRIVDEQISEAEIVAI